MISIILPTKFHSSARLCCGKQFWTARNQILNILQSASNFHLTYYRIQIFIITGYVSIFCSNSIAICLKQQFFFCGALYHVQYFRSSFTDAKVSRYICESVVMMYTSLVYISGGQLKIGGHFELQEYSN